MTLEEQIRSDIEARIHSGDLKPGDRIPFEHEFVATYRCARATVNKALTGLSRKGLIERRRKAGSFVAHPQVHSAVLAVPDLAEVMAARGEVYRWQPTERKMAAGTTDVPAPALLISGIHFGAGEPFALERRLISLSTVPEAVNEQFDEIAPGTWLLQRVPWTAARHRIRAVEATAGEARTLSVRMRSACLELERVTWRAGAPVTHVRQLFRGDRFDLVAEFQPGA